LGVRLRCWLALSPQLGDELAPALDECFEFADLLIQLRKTIGLHRVTGARSDLRPAYIGHLTTWHAARLQSNVTAGVPVGG
jgi:hypothetical protein